MRRVVRPDPCGWLLDGRWYGSEAEFREALAARAERRARILALIEKSSSSYDDDDEDG